MKLESEQGKIVMRGMIGNFEGCISSDDFMDLLRDQDGEDVTIELDSEGGCVRSGMSIHNQIRRYKGQVTVHIDAMCASIATVIACAADVVVMNHNAQFMIHNAWTAAMGDAKEFRSMASILDMLDAQIAETYAERGEPSADEWKAMMDEETFLNAEQAMELGLVDAIDRPAAKKTKKKPVTAEAAMQSSMIALKAGNLRKQISLSIRK